MTYRVIIDNDTVEISTDKIVAIINNKIIKASSFSQLKRLASIEANKKYNMEDTFYLLGLNGTPPLCFIRRNKKAANNTIIRGLWT